MPTLCTKSNYWHDKSIFPWKKNGDNQYIHMVFLYCIQKLIKGQIGGRLIQPLSPTPLFGLYSIGTMTEMRHTELRLDKMYVKLYAELL